MLDQFEFVWESSPEDKLVFSSSIVGSNLLSDEALVISIDSHTFDKTIYLTLELTINSLALRVEIHFAFLVEYSLFSILASIREFFSVNEELW